MKVLIADDHGVVRQGLRGFLERQEHLEVIGEAQDGAEAIALARQLTPDIIIMDVSMPRANGVEAARCILRESAEIKIIALSMHTERRFVIEMLKAGAMGYVLKSCLFDEVLRAISTVAANGYYLSPKITDLIVGDYLKEDAPAVSSELSCLTDRELEMIRYLANGKTVKQIALLMHISPKTADAARRKVMKKLDVESLVDLTKFAIRNELIFLDA